MLGKLKNNFILHLLMGFSILFAFFALYMSPIKAESLKCSDYGKRILSQEDYDKIIAICDAEIAAERKALKAKQGETTGVKYEIKKLDQKIRLSQAYINKKIAKINRLRRDKKANIRDIEALSRKLEKINSYLTSLIFQRNQTEANTALEAILSSKTLSEFFQDTDLTSFVERKIAEEIKKVKKERDSLQRLTIELEERETVEKELMEEKRAEARKIEKNKRYKNELLGILKKEEGGLKVSITSKEKAKQAILKKKFTVASGAKVSFGEAYHIINPYKKALGMDPAFVLAILFQESGMGGRIGGNIGRCTYNQKNKYGSAKGGHTVMRNDQKKAFLSIMKGIGKNPKTQKVSCPIHRDGGYGGAMGPAQFMPNTWMEIRGSAAKIIGKSPSKMSPFVNHDAFIASAAYLKKQYYSASCNKYARDYKHIQSTRTLRERCAAARYYAGGS